MGVTPSFLPFWGQKRQPFVFEEKIHPEKIVIMPNRFW
jgi:hypothetical protein